MGALRSSRFTALVAVCALWTQQVRAGAVVDAVDSLCLEACQQCLPATYFADADPAAPARRACEKTLAVESTYLCMRVYCSDAARARGITQLAETCPDHPMPGYDVIGHYTDAEVAAFRRLQHKEKVPKADLKELVVPSVELFTLWWKTLTPAREDNELLTYDRLAMNIFWGVVVVLAAINHLTTRFFPFSKVKRNSSRKLSSFGKLSVWLKRNVFVPATFGRRRAERVWWCTVPQRSQTIVIGAFILLNVFFSVYGYRETFEGDLYYPSRIDQRVRQVSDRTGIISFACFPVIWLFGMRNSLLQSLTGWDFGAWSNFHRWVARVAALQAVVHSVGYTILIWRFGGWHYYTWWWTQLFWWTGQLATIGMCILLGVSVYWVRKFQYEAFLIMHIVLSIIVLVTMLGHVSIFNGQYDLPFWIPLGIWILDRVLRLLRIVSFNPRPWATKALATAYVPQPGTYYYLMILNDARCWESHPFTLASVSNLSLPSKCFGEDTPLLLEDEITEADAIMDQSEAMTFLIRPYDSFTGRLRDRAAQQAGGAALRVLVEGPYGDTWPLHRFDSVLFVVGGSGIVVALSYLRTLLADTNNGPAIHIHWATREARLVEDVLNKDFGDLLASEQLTVEVYIKTLPEQGGIIDAPSSVHVHRRRLDAAALVSAAAKRAEGQNLAVVACGPARMADDTRRATIDTMDRGSGDIQYFEENFEW
ncbi:Ferric/cupric reductase transmembrane component B [Paramyrothecium foliicola]|nr:Ferric/cupric reductase transmembrane component B [Paramyrothecium foliicola]